MQTVQFSPSPSIAAIARIRCHWSERFWIWIKQTINNCFTWVSIKRKRVLRFHCWDVVAENGWTLLSVYSSNCLQKIFGLSCIVQEWQSICQRSPQKIILKMTQKWDIENHFNWSQELKLLTIKLSMECPDNLKWLSWNAMRFSKIDQSQQLQCWIIHYFQPHLLEK